MLKLSRNWVKLQSLHAITNGNNIKKNVKKKYSEKSNHLQFSEAASSLSACTHHNVYSLWAHKSKQEDGLNNY